MYIYTHTHTHRHLPEHVLGVLALFAVVSCLHLFLGVHFTLRRQFARSDAVLICCIHVGASEKEGGERAEGIRGVKKRPGNSPIKLQSLLLQRDHSQAHT
jgi:hypothetical protein